MVVYILGPMEDTREGLTDKLYWRKARGQWHCFKKIAQFWRLFTSARHPERGKLTHRNNPR
jgi:hypothetical protein